MGRLPAPNLQGGRAAVSAFDANLSFVQALTEAVKDTKNTLLVASLPASQIEVGGEGGQKPWTG